MQVKKRIFNIPFKLLIIFLILFSLCDKTNTKKKKEKDQITSIYEWAKLNNIYINKKMVLNKYNPKGPHNFLYFTADEAIPNNTVLLRVNYSSMLSFSILNKFFNETKNKKFSSLWYEMNKLEGTKYFDIKQLIYLGIILEGNVGKKKSLLYKKNKEYFDMYENINLDRFPIYFDEEEIAFLAESNLGQQIHDIKESFNEEYHIVNGVLNLTDVYIDNYIKYRIIAEANSISFNNSNVILPDGSNETVIIPFIDCFIKVVNESFSNVQYRIKNDTGYYYLEIFSTKPIDASSYIILKWLNISNQESLVQYGFIDENNFIKPSFYIDTFCQLFQEDIEFPYAIDLEKVLKRETYEVNTEYADQELFDSYKNLSEIIEDYNETEEGPYELMKENLDYYMKLYTEQLTDGNINVHIVGKEKIKYMKRLMRDEEESIKKAYEFVKQKIRDIKIKNRDIDEGNKSDKKDKDKDKDNKPINDL